MVVHFRCNDSWTWVHKVHKMCISYYLFIAWVRLFRCNSSWFNWSTRKISPIEEMDWRNKTFNINRTVKFTDSRCVCYCCCFNKKKKDFVPCRFSSQLQSLISKVNVQSVLDWFIILASARRFIVLVYSSFN